MLEPIEIAKLEEHRQAVGSSEIAREWEAIAGGRMTAGEPGSWINQACGLGLEGPVSDEQIDRFVDFYESRGIEPKIEVCPFADESLVLGLAARGFGVVEFEAVFARDLAGDEELIVPEVMLADGRRVVIERIDPEAPDAEALAEVNARVGMSGFLPAGGEITEGMLEIGRNLLRHERTIMTNAWAEDASGQREAIAAGAMETAPPVSCLFGVTVLEPYRRRGVQQAMIMDRVKRSKETGCSLACIHSKPGIPTERNAMRLGFRIAYHKVVMTRPGEGLAASR